MIEKKDNPLYRHIPSSNEIQAIINRDTSYFIKPEAGIFEILQIYY